MNDGTIDVEKLGRDHRSTLLYVETRCVDYSGKVEIKQLRCNPLRHPLFAHEGGWDDDYSTRQAKGVEHVVGHDDWDCIDDMETMGLIEWNGTGPQPVFKLTDAGWTFAHVLRRQRAEKTR
jgi:hypothetical protein